MRHLKNRSLEKCLISYPFFNLELFHPQNGEILTEQKRDFSIAVFLKQFLIPRFQDARLPTFSISLMLATHRDRTTISMLQPHIIILAISSAKIKAAIEQHTI